MNFKTPFKVLTTAALIGTLSLSAVAPGAASAATPAVSAQEAEAATAVEKILFEKDGKQYEINLEEYLILVATQATLVEDSTPISVVSPTTGKLYDLEEFLLTQALNEEDTAKAFELLDADETKAQDFKPFTVELDENGAPIVKDPTETPDSDFKVTEIAAITTTGVDVKFQALTADLKDVTVEVKNSKGETVAVNPVNLKEGATTASFDFTTAVTEADLTGEWTVNGKAYSFNQAELVAKINETAAESSLVNFTKALENASLENIDKDLVSGYKEAVKEANPEFTTLDQVQAAVDKVNAQYSKVKAVIEATYKLSPEVRVFEELETNFDNVNADWSEDYLNASVELADGSDVAIRDLSSANYAGTKAVTAEAIQEAINRVDTFNSAVEIVNISNEELTAAKIAKVKDLVSKYADLADDPDAKVSASDFVKTVAQELELIYNVDKATSKAAVKSALEKLVEFDASLRATYGNATTVEIVAPFTKNVTVPGGTINATSLDPVQITVHAHYKSAQLEDLVIVDDNLEAYIKAFDQTSSLLKNSRPDVLNVVSTTNTTEAGKVIDKLQAKAGEVETAYNGGSGTVSATLKSELIKALQAVGVKNVTTDNKDEYVKIATQLKTATAPNADTGLATDAQVLVDVANINAVVTNKNSASALIKSLNTIGAENVVAENVDYYLNNAAFTALTAGSAKGADVKAKVKAISEALKTANKKAVVQKSVEAINKAKSASEVKTALDDLSLASYIALPSVDQEFVASQLLSVRDKLTKDRVVVADTGAALGSQPSVVNAKEFNDIAELTAYFETGVDETVVKIDLDGDGAKTTTSIASIVDNYESALNAVNAIAKINTKVDVATILDTAEYAGFFTGFDGDEILTNAETALAEKFIEKLVFATTADTAADTTLTEGNLKASFKSLSAVNALLK